MEVRIALNLVRSTELTCIHAAILDLQKMTRSLS